MLFITEDSKHRFLPGDIDQFNLFYKADIAHSQTKLYKRKLLSAKNIIDKAFETCSNIIVSTSWGKDSQVITDLCYNVNSNVKVVHVKQDKFSTGEVKKETINKYNLNYIEIQKERIEVEDLKCHNDGIYSESNKMRSKLFVKSLIKMNMLGDCHVMGLRADESAGRKIRFKKYSSLHECMDGKYSCCPLWDWTAQDVFAYHAVNDLITHPWYAMLSGGRDRHHIRVSALVDLTAATYGRIKWVKTYYGDVLDKYMRLYEDISTYV